MTPRQKAEPGAAPLPRVVRGEAARVALDEHWRKVFAGDPAQRAAFDGLCAQYTAIKRAQGR